MLQALQSIVQYSIVELARKSLKHYALQLVLAFVVKKTGKDIIVLNELLSNFYTINHVLLPVNGIEQHCIKAWLCPDFTSSLDVPVPALEYQTLEGVLNPLRCRPVSWKQD